MRSLRGWHTAAQTRATVAVERGILAPSRRGLQPASRMHRLARMKNHRRRILSCCAAVGLLALGASTAHAQEYDERQREMDLRAEQAEAAREARAEPQPRHSMGFVEATGAYGVQFGETDYLPAGAAGSYEHPIVHGFGVGGTAGVTLIPGLSAIANYEYSNARSRTGSVQGVIDEVQGFIDYHTIVAGLRLSVPVGFGALQAELAGGVVLPFETELQVAYGPALGAAGIAGTGSRIESYSIGFGGHGMIGYRIPIFDFLYTAINVKLRTFQSENSGETTQLRNFVTDFEAQPPVATDGAVTHGEGAARPSTQSVQDVRLQLAIGAEF